MADLIYKTYHTMYIIEPGETQTVEANPDPNGLKLGVIYETRKDKQEMFFHRFTCGNDTILTITSVDGNDIDYYGEGTSLQGKGKLRESSVDPFNMAAATLENEFAKPREPTKAEQEVKKFFRNVKESSEAVIQKVGDKLNLDLTGQIAVYNSNNNGSISESASNASLNSMNNENRLMKNNSQYDEYQNGNHVPSFYQQPNQNINSSNLNNINSNRNYNGGIPTPSSLTNSPSSRAGGGGHFVKIEENKQFQAPVQKAVDPAEEAKKWEEDLERTKKEKRWEAEIDRIKKERELRAAEEAEARKNPHKYAPPDRPPGAPVADANCKVCVIS
eukprot:CAMPEP_0173159050 /NCGR_PEP_ID=MMETSP1105-20130129/16829_1 /TAXON_ID=2985 /ORGANISM="Ochromonas sp., Strain BG-1" /LENGTH=330 /DNA_ID=CAMNT_0014077311 /DNA_START=36 /DNA_END=1029 /DNA_ORIENTATION=-